MFFGLNWLKTNSKIFIAITAIPLLKAQQTDTVKVLGFNSFLRPWCSTVQRGSLLILSIEMFT